ncbi:MAG: hypothetical protein IID44_27175 [Planctomycetes bacterium]|nr:hypothetical protein [Planctomycetota bacterium]
MSRIFLSAALIALFSAGVANAAIIGVAGGTGAPSSTLGAYTMTPFPDDTRPTFTDVTDVAAPNPPVGGVVGFSIPLSHREIGAGLATWSHGYTGDVYYTKGATSVTLTRPANTGAFYLYAEPNQFATFEITAVSASGTSVMQSVAGASGASYFGFHSTDPFDAIVSIEIVSSTDFAIGEFGIAQVIPEPSMFIIWSFLGAVGITLGWRRGRNVA